LKHSVLIRDEFMEGEEAGTEVSQHCFRLS